MGDPTAVQKAAISLVVRNPALQDFAFLCSRLRDVPLDSRMAKQSGNRAEPDLVVPAGGVRVRWADMRVNKFRWQHLGGPALNALTFEGFIAVGGMHAIGVLHDAEIDSSAA